MSGPTTVDTIFQCTAAHTCAHVHPGTCRCTRMLLLHTPDRAAEMLPIVTAIFSQCRKVRSLAAGRGRHHCVGDPAHKGAHGDKPVCTEASKRTTAKTPTQGSKQPRSILYIPHAAEALTEEGLGLCASKKRLRHRRSGSTAS